MSVSAQSEVGETRPSEVWSVELESSKKTRLCPSPTDHFYFFPALGGQNPGHRRRENLAKSFSWPPAFCCFSAKKRRLISASKGHRGNFVRPPLALKTASTYHRKGAPMSRVVCVPQETFDVPPGDRLPPQTPSLDLSPSPSCCHLV